MSTQEILDNMYQLGLRHGIERSAMYSAGTITIYKVCKFLESLTTSEENLAKLRLALEEVTVEPEDEQEENPYNDVERENCKSLN